MLCQYTGEMLALLLLLSYSVLMRMDTIYQVLYSYYIIILRNLNWSSNGKGLLNKRGRDSNHPLNWGVAALALIVCFTVVCCCWEVCIKVGVAQSPGSRCQVEPGVSRWIGNNLTRSFKRSIKQ